MEYSHISVANPTKVPERKNNLRASLRLYANKPQNNPRMIQMNTPDVLTQSKYTPVEAITIESARRYHLYFNINFHIYRSAPMSLRKYLSVN